MAIVGLVGAFCVFVIFAWRDVTEYDISAEDVARIDRERRTSRRRYLLNHEVQS